MARWLRFVLVLVPGLALVSWGVWSAAGRASRAWFEYDTTQRAVLAVAAAREGLLGHWRPAGADDVARVLGEIARDPRIIGAAACRLDGSRLAATSTYPAPFDCPFITRQLSNDGWDATRSEPWTNEVDFEKRGVHVTAVSLLEGAIPVGVVVLLHDSELLRQLQAQSRKIAWLGFAALAAGTWIVTLVATRLSRRDWADELRRLLRTGESRPDYQPVLEDLRQLAQALASEIQQEGGRPAWTPERLHDTLTTKLRGESVVVVANREPYIHERGPSGDIVVRHPASGLVTALEPVMEACSGVWVAHGGGSADRETADGQGRLPVPPNQGAYTLQRVWLSDEEERGYYYGFANEGLWPLCHVAHIRPVFRAADFAHYGTVNARFAAAAARAADRHDPVILVQDYHFALVPQMILRRQPRATVIAFWHVPWPNAERFGICPWRTQLLEGLLGSSILGFHTQLHCNNFIDTVDRFLEARIDRERFAVIHRGHTTLVRPYPISIEWPSRWARSSPDAATCRAQVVAEHGLAPDALIGIGVDRLDYTKGIEERLLAVERLLEKHPGLLNRFVFLQIAAPSRSAIGAYQELEGRVDRHAVRINARFGSGAYRPIVLMRAHHEPPDVFRHYRAADVCYVSSLHDGMNLVAKEFVAARDDERGVLVLSSFTGASRELSEALVVNPYDIEEASDALAAALAMAPDEQQERMRAMRALVAHFNVYRWAGRMLIDASHLRDRERRSDRLAAWPSASAAAS
jgi:trehalose 6-phosphate synthase